MSSKDREVVLHFVFTPKYRRSVFVADVALRLQEITQEVCDELNVEVLAIAIQPDHCHVLISEPRSLTRAYFVQRVKGRASRLLRQEFPHLVEQMPNALWGRDYFVRSVGGGRKAVVRYIAEQVIN